MPNVPEYLRDGSTLAKAVWEYWTSIMRTDKVIKDEDFPTWDNLDDGMKTTLVETLTMHVVKPIEVALTAPENAVAACYTCAAVAVSYPGQMCTKCYYELVYRKER